MQSRSDRLVQPGDDEEQKKKKTRGTEGRQGTRSKGERAQLQKGDQRGGSVCEHGKKGLDHLKARSHSDVPPP